MIKPIFFILFFFCFIITINAQDISSIEEMKNLDISEVNNDYLKPYTHKDIHQHHLELSKGSSNELEFVFSNLFMLYKNFISSQDFSHCMFTPSCSEYGIIAIKRIGFIEGIVSTFDRLTRCHPLILPNEYPIDEEKGLYIDEP